MAEYKIGETISELEMLDGLKLFRNHELRRIAEEIGEFDRRIQRISASKDDYKSYIQYKLDLLKTIEARKRNRGMPPKLTGAEYYIVNQVDNIFNQAGHRFQDDLTLSTSHFKFCDKMGINGSYVLARILQTHGAKSPDYWKIAAQYELEKRNALENALQLILRGLKFHPESSVLYEQAFLYELMLAVKVAEEKSKLEENIVAENGPERLSTGFSGSHDASGTVAPEVAPGVIDQLDSINKKKVIDEKPALLMYQLGASKLKDVKFLINCLSIAKEFSFSMKIQEKIVNDLLNNYHDNELTWDTMARRELEGLSYSSADPGHMPSGSASTMPNTFFAVAADSPSVLGSSTQELEARAKIKRKTKVSLRERLRRCCDIYDAGVKKLDTEHMWALYIECLLELLGNGTGGLERFEDSGEGGNASLATSQPNPLPRYTRKLLLRAFRGAHNACKMTEKYYLMWVDYLLGENTPNATLATFSGKPKKCVKGSKEKRPLGLGAISNKGLKRKKMNKLYMKAARILEEGTNQLPQSAELWMTRLKHHICHSSAVTGNGCSSASGDQSPPISSIPEAVFAKACSQLGGSEVAEPIWKVMLHYLQGIGDTARVENLFQDAIKREPPISLVFKPLYVEWLVLQQGIIAARKVYNQISAVPPLCLELHTKMAYLEEMQPKVNVKQTRKCYELACQQFGKSSSDVWLAFIKFEVTKGDRGNVTPIYEQAVNSLDNLQANIFKSELARCSWDQA